MKKFLNILLVAIIVLSGLSAVGANVSAKITPSDGGINADAGAISSADSEKVFFYALNSKGESVLLKVISLDDLKKLQHGQLSDITSGEDTGRDYDISSINNLPAAQYCEAKGFTIPDLINYIKEIATVSGADKITYNGNDKIHLMTTDSYGVYTGSWTYDDLYGVMRYYFEGLYDSDTGWNSGWQIDSDISDIENYYLQYKDTDDYYDDKYDTFIAGIPTAAILAMESFSGTTTGESSGSALADYISANGGVVSGCVSDMLNDTQALKLCIPMTEADLMFANSTASQNIACVYNMRLDMSSLPFITSQGTVAYPQADLSINSDNNTMTITMSCATRGASIYYSFDGAPRILYTEPVSIDVEGRDLSTNPITLYMTAVKEGWDDAGIISVNCPDNSDLVMISEDGDLGYTANTLTIEVGYFGGPFYEKYTFTLDELKNMDLVHADYTFIDNMPSVIIDHVEGVRLSDILERAGIDLNSVETFYFWTEDVASSYFTSFTKKELIDIPRYCYYSLPENFDYDEGKGNEYADSDGQLVDTVIALSDDWGRCISGATFGSDYTDLNINTRFRLIFGQKDTETPTACRSAKWIHSIVVELGGAPTLSIDSPSILDLEVGSLFRTEASIETADPVISENADIEWSSSDDSVATVDSDGNVTVHSEGTAIITASFMGVSSSFVVNGTAKDSSSNTGITEIISHDPAEQGDDYYLQQSGVSSEGDNGGVQNWRIYEMSESASELPVIKEDNSLLPVIAVLAVCLLIGGAMYRILKFKFDMVGG